jgi:hypothetical protein
MGANATIRRKDRKPLGDREQVFERLCAVFPGIKFASRPNGEWSGAFEENGLAMEFYPEATSPIFIRDYPCTARSTN